MSQESKPKSGYWYEYHSEYCPVCGASDRWKERVYDRPKPEEPADRYVFKEVYNYCEG